MNPWDEAWDTSKVKGASPFDAALAAEGVSGPVADIARSIYTQESSSGKNTKTSNRGAVGGMQILPGTFASVADKGWDIGDPVQNARAGIRYLKQGYDAAGGDPALTGAFYYGGPGGLEKARKGIAVSDPLNPNAPNTLQYGQQVAARLPKEKGMLQRGVEAVIPSAQAAELPSAQAKMPWDEEWAAPAKTAPAAPAPSVMDKIADGAGRIASGFVQGSKDLAGGAVRGAGSIGATLLAPGDYMMDKIMGDRGPNVSGLVTGQQPLSRNEERRNAMTQGLKEMGVNTDSLSFGAGKLGGEIAGTAGAGPVLATAARGMGAAPTIVNALRSGGMSLGAGAPAAGVAQVAGNALTRVGAGAATGAASAALVNPEDAKSGAIIGGAIPGAASALAPVGRAIGNRLATNAAQQTAAYARNAPLAQTLQDGVQAGYVVPPSSVNPTLYNTVKESIGGKIATAQAASTRNQEVTDRLVRQALGVAPDAPLTTEALQAYRTAQFQAGYEPVRQLGMVRADQQFDDALTNIIRANTGRGTIAAVIDPEIARLANAHRSGGFDAGDALDAMRQLRETADDAFRTGNTRLGRTSRAIADAYEAAIERSIPQNQAQLLDGFRDARANMARSFTVEDALKEGTGAVDARKLGNALQKGVPLDGDLLVAARFASAFPKATQPPSMVAGAGVHNLKAGLASLSAGAGAATLGPLGAVAGAAYPFLVPPAVRAQMFSQRAQNALIPRAPQANALLRLGQNPGAQNLLQFGARSAPVLAQDH